MTTEQPSVSDLNPYQTYALEDLKAYTKYAVYIQAYTLVTATHSAVTNVETFITSPSCMSVFLLFVLYLLFYLSQK